MSSATMKLSNAADAVLSEEMRKGLGTMKTLAVDYEKDGKSDKVQKLEEAALELIASCEDCTSFAEAVQAVPRAYQPSDQVRALPAVMRFFGRSNWGNADQLGCPRVLQVGKVVGDSLLRVEIEELRSSGPAAPNATNIEDFTDVIDDDDDSN